MYKTILFFDGVCNLCNSSVDFVIRHRKDQSIHFAPLQGATAASLLPAEYLQLSSLVLYSDGKIYDKSQAAIRLSSLLKFPFNIFTIFRFLPTPLTDFFYDRVAKNRYRWFGKKETCRIPTPEERTFFIP